MTMRKARKLFTPGVMARWEELQHKKPGSVIRAARYDLITWWFLWITGIIGFIALCFINYVLGKGPHIEALAVGILYLVVISIVIFLQHILLPKDHEEYVHDL